MSQREQQPGASWGTRAGSYLIPLTVGALAVSLEVVLHRRMGKNSVGVRGALAFIMIPMWTVFWPEMDPGPLFVFWLLFLLGCVRNRFKPAPPGWHTRYTGEPVLLRFVPKFLRRKIDESRFKSKVEPLMVFVLGAVLMEFVPILGSFLLTAAIGLFISLDGIERITKAKAERLCDARIDQEHLVQRFREMSGDR